jgi:leader peptidase (prepilin peptidase)/N-methyltransferase
VLLNLAGLLTLFFIGLIVGTFLTTCTERLPFTDDDFYGPEIETNEWYYNIPLFSVFLALPLFTRFKILLPKSRCIQCRKILPLSERIPVLSYFLLRFRCSECRHLIPGRYWITELITGILFFYSGYHFGLSWKIIPALILTSLFIVASVVDLKYQIIPDEVTVAGLIAGFFLSLSHSIYDLFSIKSAATASIDWQFLIRDTFFLNEGSLGWAVSGFLAGAGSLTFLYYVGTYIAGTDAMGQGDVKLAGFIGMFLGAKGVLIALFLSTVLGACSGILVLTLGWGVREDGFTKFAFGPYICAGSLITFYFSPEVIIKLYGTFNEHIVMYISGHIL